MNKDNTIKFLLLLILFVAVLACGIYGYAVGENFSLVNAVFYSIKLFLGDAGAYSENIFLNISKYGAMIISASFVVSLFNKLSEGIVDYFVGKDNNSIFVYGDNDFSREFIRSSTHKIINRHVIKKASKYVFLSDDEDNMKFYSENKEYLADKPVYVKNALFANTIIGNHRFFSLEQIAARRFWRENSLIDKAFDENGSARSKLDITIVGKTRLSEQILFESVLTNIYSVKQKVTYHLFGDWTDFRRTHINSDKLGFIYYDSDCLDNIDVLSDSAVVLFFDEARKLYDLLNVLPEGNVVYFTSDLAAEELYRELKYGKNDRLTFMPYDYLQNVCTEQEIIDEKSVLDAKRVNYNYYVKNNPNGTDTIDEQWAKLSSFHKLSNMACVDFYSFTITRLLEKLTGKKYRDVSDAEFSENLETISELEHIRWNNFHYYCNWTYDPNTDKKAKKHNCLVRYEELPREEQIKDAVQMQQVRNLLK